jgi:hypothetical protein
MCAPFRTVGGHAGPKDAQRDLSKTTNFGMWERPLDRNRNLAGARVAVQRPAPTLNGGTREAPTGLSQVC